MIKECINRISGEPNVQLYVVEMAYQEQPFIITESDNQFHLQLRCNVPLYHRENMVNLGIKKLLPADWKAVAWIDADIEFENIHWAMDTLKVLNKTCNVVQVFSHCQFINDEGHSKNVAQPYCKHVMSSVGFNHAKGMKYKRHHPYAFLQHWAYGFGIACTREAYMVMEPWFQIPYGHTILLACMNNQAIEDLQALFGVSNEQCAHICIAMQTNITLGYVPGLILHHFHGTIENKDMGEIGHYIRYWHTSNHIFTINEEGILTPSDRQEAADYCNAFMQYIERRNVEPQLVSTDINSLNIKTYIRTRMTDDSSTPVWGPMAWILLHSLAQRLHKVPTPQLIDVLNILLRNTPCEICSKHASEYLTTHEFSVRTVQTQYDLIYYLFTFHNNINKLHNKPLFKIEQLESTYNTIPFRVLYDYFTVVYCNEDIKGQTQALDDIKTFFTDNVLDEIRP